MDWKGCVYLSRLLGVALLTTIFPPYDVTAQPDELREYCEDNTLEARCEADEVIVMRTARYGRMRLGTCLSIDFGHQGCVSSVLKTFDLWCSGRPTCDVAISDLLSKVPQPCPKDLRNYLEASYTCTKVVWPTVQRCVSTNPLIKLDSGYLSNYVTEKTLCGNIDSPWVLEVPQGQQINLTLFDFAYHPTSISDHPNICQVLAVIKDRGTGANTATKTICNGIKREEHLMTSQSNEVEIRFVLKTRATEDGRYHIVKFEAVGCPDLEQTNMWFHRTLTTARVGCEDGDDSWQLLCEGKEWKGNIPECVNDAQLPVIGGPDDGVPYGVSVAIILAIALMIGAVILTVGLVVIRRRRGRNTTTTIQRDHSKISKDDCYVERIPYTDHGPAQGYHPGDSPYNRENTYYRTWELQRHAPHTTAVPMPPHGGHACSAATVPAGYQGTHTREDSPPNYLEHIYESPKSVRKEIDAMTGSDSLKYYELDPSISDGKRPNSSDVTS